MRFQAITFLGCAAVLAAACGDDATSVVYDSGVPPIDTGTGESHCDRPDGIPLERGAIGTEGCSNGLFCVVSPNQEQGTCAESVCSITGLIDGVTGGLSPHCSPDEVCTVGSGNWFGNCADATLDSELSTGTLTCDAPQSVSLSVGQMEVIDFEVLFNPPANVKVGVNASTEVHDGEGAVVANGNPIGGFAAVYAEEQTVAFRHGFGAADDVNWTFRVEQCNETDYAASYHRRSGPVLNSSTERATPIASGQTVGGVIGCPDTSGDSTVRSVVAYYAIEASTGDTLALSFGERSFDDDSSPGGTLIASLLDSTGEPILESGNPIFVDTTGKEDATRSVAITQTGTHYIAVSQDMFGCNIARYTLTATLQPAD